MHTDFAVHTPPPELRPYVAFYVGFRACGILPSVHSGVPTHYAGMVLSQAEPIDLVRTPGDRGPLSLPSYVSGLQTGPTTIRYGRRRDGLFIHLTPAGLRAILGVASSELAGRVVDLRDIWPRPAAELLDRLTAATTWEKRFAVLDDVFLESLRPVIVARELSWAWGRLLECHGSIPIQQLADEIGWSRQHFRERFYTAFGVPPKTAARIFRFERAMRLLKKRRSGLAEIAAESGYHDQAHMTLEWKELAGCTPKAWIRNELPFFQYSTPLDDEY
jgi:AraC-like DNA-binding protein